MAKTEAWWVAFEMYVGGRNARFGEHELKQHLLTAFESWREQTRDDVDFASLTIFVGERYSAHGEQQLTAQPVLRITGHFTLNEAGSEAHGKMLLEQLVALLNDDRVIIPSAITHKIELRQYGAR